MIVQMLDSEIWAASTLQMKPVFVGFLQCLPQARKERQVLCILSYC